MQNVNRHKIKRKIDIKIKDFNVKYIAATAKINVKNIPNENQK